MRAAHRADVKRLLNDGVGILEMREGGSAGGEGGG